MAFRIIVSTEEEKEELLIASRYIHDSPISPHLKMVDLISKLYLIPEAIVVDPVLAIEI